MRSLHSIPDAPRIPKIIPLPHENHTSDTSLSLNIVEGPTLNLWSMATATQGDTKEELTLQLQPDEAVVIGRQEGGRIEYLDPCYQPTQMLPNSGQRVVTSPKSVADTYVSRGHIMLKGRLHGILLVNGVPRQGGGIRPPKNGTKMLEPTHRQMVQGEEYMIEMQATVKICLPNGTVILLRAGYGGK